MSLPPRGDGRTRSVEDIGITKRTVPMGRVTRADDVAGAIVAFASNLASFATGQMIVCDGGRLLTNPINAGSPPEPTWPCMGVAMAPDLVSEERPGGSVTRCHPTHWHMAARVS